MEAKSLPTPAQALEEVRNNPMVPVWPTAAVLLGLRRQHAYESARRGEIETVTFGQIVRAKSAALLKKIGAV